jgi:phosphomannomutase
MTSRILSISGLRGVIGDGLDPEYIVRFASALGAMFNGGTVVLARDGRSTGPYIKHAVTSALLASGCKVLDADIAATPTCGVLVQELNAAGGLQITASHNPIEWNGLKPFGPDGSVFDKTRGEELLDRMENSRFSFAKWQDLGSVETIEDPFAPHQARVLKLVDADKIRAKKFKVVLDCNRGSGAVGGPGFLRDLGCEVVVLGETPDGDFEHVPEPTKENLTGLCDAIRSHKADIGFAQDPDADRLAIVDENGAYIGEELTLALSLEFVLRTRKGAIVVNGSTSRVNADIAERHGCTFHRSHVGEANVCAMMRDLNAEIGGEGNGGVIEPAVGYVRDSFVSMAYVLAAMCEDDCSVSELVSNIPRYNIIKNKVQCDRSLVSAACEALKVAYPEADAAEGDGLRLDWPDRWVQVRASNTEPILRVIAEAQGEEVATKLCQEAMAAVENAIK